MDEAQPGFTQGFVAYGRDNPISVHQDVTMASAGSPSPWSKPEAEKEKTETELKDSSTSIIIISDSSELESSPTLNQVPVPV
jgi:hypothetical protein